MCLIPSWLLRDHNIIILDYFSRYSSYRDIQLKIKKKTLTHEKQKHALMFIFKDCLMLYEELAVTVSG